MNYLFVCNKNRIRSPDAAEWCASYCAGSGVDAEVRSAGINANPIYATRLRQEHIDWADYAFVMEGWIKEEILYRFVWHLYPKNIVDLGIPDVYCSGLERSHFPYDDSVSSSEAVRLLDKHYGGPEDYRLFGKEFFHKLLKGKLEGILRGEQTGERMSKLRNAHAGK